MEGGIKMSDHELDLMEKAIDKIYLKAKEFGLDFYDMRFEILPADILYTFGAYGMPTRFSHWSFGKQFHQMKTMYDYNLSRIYELVINSDPCYAFLLEGNTLIQNKLVIAHVFAHCDFFKNNSRFAHTSRKMVESMASSAERIREYEFKYGRDKVETLIDSVLSIQEHIDPNFHLNDRIKDKKVVIQESPYDDLWDLDKVKQEDELKEKETKFPKQPQKDLLLFIMENARDLKDWERDIISILRDEIIYFWPQMETKIMNEGWASYWHIRIMRELDLTDDETIEFAKMNAGVIQPSKTHLNPYYLGLKIWEDIEKRWDNPSDEERKKYGRMGNEGKEKIFEVRATESDVSFIRNYLTKELVEELDLFLFKKVGIQWQVTDTNWESVRDGLVSKLTNCGIPFIVVEDGDYEKNGELYLKHRYEGQELDIPYLERTLVHVYNLWGRQVHLESVNGGKPVLFSYNGTRNTKKLL